MDWWAGSVAEFEKWSPLASKPRHGLQQMSRIVAVLDYINLGSDVPLADGTPVILPCFQAAA